MQSLYIGEKGCVNNMIQRKYLSITDIAAITGVSRQSIWQAIKDNVILAVRFGSKWLIPCEELDKYLHSGKTSKINEEQI